GHDSPPRRPPPPPFVKVRAKASRRGKANGVEAVAVAHAAEPARERLQHPMLPEGVLPLRVAVPHSEGGRMRPHLPQCSITQGTAQEELDLVLGEAVVLYESQYLVLFAQIARRHFASGGRK